MKANQAQRTVETKCDGCSNVVPIPAGEGSRFCPLCGYSFPSEAEKELRKLMARLGWSTTTLYAHAKLLKVREVAAYWKKRTCANGKSAAKSK